MEIDVADVQEILRRIGKHWAEGRDGGFASNWDENDAAPGYWLPAEDAAAIVRAYAELQLALNPIVKAG
jgi:hypothetical protein